MQGKSMQISGDNSLKTQGAKPRKKKAFNAHSLFIIVMLAYPVLHFLVMWIFVNGYSISLTFQRFIMEGNDKYPIEGWNFVGLDNYALIISKLKTDTTYQSMFLTSLGYVVVSCFITLPLSIIAAYFVFKKIRGASFFRIIFFFPSIMPLVILTLIYEMALDPGTGVVNILLEKAGLIAKGDYFKWLSLGGEPEAGRAVYFFCIWAGIGYNVILLNSGMGKIPQEIQESALLDGAGPIREFFQIVVPLTWPTISTLFILGMMSCINVYMQPLFLTGGKYSTRTIALEIFSNARSNTYGDLTNGATLGLFCTIILAPIILTVKHFMEKCFADVEF